jgi:hypothetical protein
MLVPNGITQQAEQQWSKVIQWDIKQLSNISSGIYNVDKVKLQIIAYQIWGMRQNIILVFLMCRSSFGRKSNMLFHPGNNVLEEIICEI